MELSTRVEKIGKMFFKDSNFKLALKNLFCPKKNNHIILEPHMGLGDALINLGLIKTLAKRYSHCSFYYACLPIYYHSMAWMLQDIDNVFPLVVSSGREARQYTQFKNAQYLSIGVTNVNIKKFDLSFYDQHQVPFHYRWELSDTPAGPRSEDLLRQLNPKKQKFLLICRKDSSSELHNLNLASASNLLTIEVTPITNNIFDWAHLVLAASEIHTIDTAFIHFVENTLHADTRQKLFFHRIRQSPTEFTRRLPWNEIKY